MEARKNWLVGLALFAVTMVLYWPATGFPFINFDDQLYVYENPHVIGGLSWSGIQWAATATVGANWHPLTLLSHMADCSIYRLFAGGHHLTNLLIHSINAVLLWLLLKRMTRSFWPSALVAALFAWHPLNVESVAWIAERKNVLSTFFFILTLWAYVRYAKNPRAWSYALALILFALGLTAKPMLVTLPFVLLLLDYWPLQRISFNGNRVDFTAPENRRLLLEKIPFAILSLADCAITYAVQNQSGSVKSLADVPLALRLFNVPVAYLTYLEKAFSPFNLSVFYPFPGQVPVAAGLVSLLFLAAITFMAWHWRFKFRWLPVGWFWFLGMMVPVIGLVQTGAQAMADRHAYVPLIGIFIVVAGLFNEWYVARPQFRALLVTGAIVFLGFCLVQTRQQLMHWQSSVALFTQAVAADPQNSFAEDMLGAALSGSGRTTEAIEHYSAAVRLSPNDAELQYHLGRELMDAGKFTEAENHLAAALRQMPGNPVLHNTLGAALMQDGQPQAAEKEFSRAVELQPDYAKPRFNLGKTLLAEGQSLAAITNLMQALQLDPDWPEALQALARAYAAAGDHSNAVQAASQALKLAQSEHDERLANDIAGELKTYQTAANAQPSAPPGSP